MDEISEFNKRCWEELSEAGVIFSRPWLDLTQATASRAMNREGVPVDVAGKDVLCLAASGGQQSAAFGILGARVTVFDLSENQLAKDRATSKHYGFPIHTLQGDMRDLGVFPIASFDIVWAAHGINFVPNARAVIAECSRVLRAGGFFRIEFTNPYAHTLWDRWNGQGYLVSEPYEDGAEVAESDPFWDVETPEGSHKRIRLQGVWEHESGDRDAEPGSWHHFESRMPPWLTVWATRAPRLPERRHRAP